MAENDTTQQQQDEAPVPREAQPTRAQRRQAEEQSAQREPRFPLERLLGPDGPAIVTSAFDGEPPAYAVSRGVLAGAFHGKDPDGDGMTRAEIRKAVEGFLTHVDSSTQEA